MGAWRVRVRCASRLYAPCFACECDEERGTRNEREKKASRSRTWRRTMVDKYRMRGRRVGVRGMDMDMACESPALFPASSTKRGNRTGSVVPSRCLSCPLSIHLSSVKSSCTCSTQMYLTGCAASGNWVRIYAVCIVLAGTVEPWKSLESCSKAQFRAEPGRRYVFHREGQRSILMSAGPSTTRQHDIGREAREVPLPPVFGGIC